jgi:hypothetical protein
MANEKAFGGSGARHGSRSERFAEILRLIAVQQPVYDPVSNRQSYHAAPLPYCGGYRVPGNWDV